MLGISFFLLQRVFKGLPKSLDGLKAIFLYPVIGVAVIGITMSLLADPMKAVNEGMMSFLASFQNSSPLVLGIIVGCMCAFDMGGPVNKAAYVTGTALLAQGNTSFMAGVSAAPHSATFNYRLLLHYSLEKYFDTNERNAGLVNFIFRLHTYYRRRYSVCGKRPIEGFTNYDARIFNCGSLNVYVWGTSAGTSWRISCFTSCYSRCSMGSGNF